MINYYDLPDAEIPMSMRALREVLAGRGWKMEKLVRIGLSDIILTRPDGKVLKIWATVSPTTSIYGTHLSKNKMMTYELLKGLSVAQPETVVVRNVKDAEEFLEKYGEIVVKPIDGSHGNGVTTNIKTLSEAEIAIKKAQEVSHFHDVALVQPQLRSDAPELRITCIDYKFVLAVARIPAAVTGDGVHSVKELIGIENETIRAKAYTSDLALIDEESALRYLGKKADDIPEMGEKVQVSSVCNIGQGGTVEDYSDKISDEMKVTAEKIARAAELSVIGIDFFGDQVIEINSEPMLYWPLADKKKAMCAVEAYADYLERL